MGRKAGAFLPAFFAGLSLIMLAPFAQAQFVHPGALSTQADLDRMAAKVAAGAQPWKGSWDILVGNQGFYMGGPEAVPTVFVDSGNGGNTYMSLARDSHRAYQAALRYHGSGDTTYADQAVRIMNAWATTHTAWDGNSNVLLRMGLYGYAFACAAELMRDYDGWAPTDFAAFQQYMRTQFYPGNSSWLAGQTNTHYWANWTLANMCSMIAIGVLCDDQAIFNEALNHFYNAVHTGAIHNMVVYVHPDGLGQWQESGRDQGHAQIGPQLIGVFCEIAWNQGHDLYGYLNNRVLSGVEYISKYNTGHAVPFAAYANSDYATWPHVYRFYQKEVAGPGGVGRPGWDLIYNHYVNRMGIAAPYTGKYAAATRPEGGGSNYGGNSGGFDGIGFTTLTHSRDPIATGAVPGTLLPRVLGRQITLSWAGSAYAQSYNVKRSTTSGGPYTTLGEVDRDSLFFVDPGLTEDTTYYYVVSANNPGGESANSAEAAATTDGQLFGTVIGSDYSYGHAGATREILFDGSLGNFMDVGGSGGGWSGLDLGSGISAVITSVKYCPRKGFANAMVGGKFQASNTADFSSGVIDLFTIAAAPPEGVLTAQTVNSGSAYRYVRYIQPASSWNTVAEVQFLGTISGQSVPSTPAANAALVNGLQIDLTWNAVPGATGYRIKRSSTPGGPYVVWGDVNTGYKEKTRFSDIETELGTTYYYLVSAYNQFGESAPSAQVAASTLPPTPQLVTHLKMSGNVADSSGYHFQANAVGSPEYPGGGYVGSSIDLDGVEDFVTLPRVASSEDITVAAWVKWDGGAAWQRLFDFGTGTAAYLYLTPSSANGTLRFGIKNGSEQFVEAPGLTVGTWTHVAVTLSGDTATLYVNGSAVASNPAVTINPSDFKPGANFIGKSQWGGDPLFNGRVDEFRVYNYALSAGNVAALAAQATEATPPAIPMGLNSTVGDKTVQLDWTDNGEPDLHSYAVYRSTTNGSGYSVIASGLTASAYTDTTVANGVTYFYVVTAVDTSGGESARSNPIAVTPRGTPVVHYRWEGNPLDDSGKGNHATATGSPTYVAGQSGQAVDLNGSSQYLRIPAGAIGTVENMTIAAWVNWDGGNNWQRIFDFGDSTSRYLFLTPSSGAGKLRFAFNNGNGEKAAETSSLAIGTWVHVAVTLNGSTTKLYVNGVAVATAADAINPVGFDFKPLNSYIGKSQFAADPLFNGRVDDFRIYNYPLTSSQVNDVKNGGSPGDDITPPAAPANLAALADGSNISLDWADNTEPDFASYTVYRSTTSGSGYVSIATGLTASAYTDTTATGGVTYYYRVTAADTAANESANSEEISATSDTLALHLKFDESAGTIAADSSGNDRHATLVNGPVFASGKINNGLSLTPASSQYATLPSGIVSDLSDFTISTWVNVNAFATWQRIFDFGSATNNYMFLTTQYTPTAPNNAKLRFGIRTPSIGEQNVSGTGIALTAGVWNHVAVVRSGTTVSLYVNGALAGSGTIALSPADLGATTLNYLGKSQFNDPYLNGSLDDFRIYSQAFSGGQVSALATVLPAPTGLAATSGDGQVSLSWDPISGATSYTVKRATAPGGPYNTQQSGVTAASFVDTGATNGTTYYYVVSASNLGGESANSAEVSATPLPPIPDAPATLTAIPGNASVTLLWSEAQGADSYTVKRATTPGGTYATLAGGLTQPNYSDTSAVNGTTYYYIVTATNLGGESEASPEASATPVAPPVTPAGLTATAGNAQIALTWSTSPGADSYTVKRSATAGGPYATVASGLAAPGFTDTGLTNETTYYYVVSATNAGGESANSAEVSATPVAPPVAPVGLATTSGDAQAVLTWSSVSGATGYNVKRATVAGGPYTTVASGLAAPGHTDSGLTNGTTYYYVVSATNAGGESPDSAEASAEPQAVPDAPTGLVATAASSSKINLAWNTVSGANSYAVKRATTTGGPYTTLASGLTATSFNDSGLTSTTTYYYVVTATSNGGESATSTEASTTTSDLRVSLAFDETSGTTANDSAGDGYHATLVNGPLFATGTLGNAVDLDGTNDHLTLPSGVMSGLSNFSISVWVKPDTVTNWSRVFDFGTGTTVNMFLTPKNAANGKVRFAITTGGGAGEQRIDGANALTAGAWSHVVVTWSGNTGILYVNGVEVGRNTTMTLNPSSLGVTNLNYLGRSQYPDPYFDGRIDDFRLYTRALGAAEISAATAAQMPLASVSGLQATAASSGQINLSWTANPNAVSYNVKRATTPGGPYTTLATGVTATSYSSSGLSAGTAYYYVVSATNVGGEGANSAETGATTFPAAPATLTATAVSSTQLNLTWGASNGATSYTVKRSATSGGAYTTLATGVTGTSYSDTGLNAGATWYYVVSASNTGESVDSTEASATTFAETPSGLAATVVSSSAIDLSWNATAGATGYDVKRSTSAGGPFDTIASAVTATAFSDSGLNAATTYHYVVAATNAAGASPDSASVNATTLPLPPATPSGLAATPGIAQVSLTWSAVSGATGYTVKRATVSGGSYAVVASDLASPSYTDTGLTNGTTYYYVVNATNTGGTSADSSEVSAAPSGLPSPWVTADIGTTGLVGSAEFANNAYTVKGAGSLGGTTDGFRYLYQPLSADGSIIARISTLEDTGSSARVGIMIRDTLATNSRMAALSVTGSGAYKWMRRTTTGGNVSNTNSSSGTAPNIWVRLVRVGNTITASKSTNGTTWTTIGSATVTMASSCYIGLAVSSGSTTTLNTSVFDNVTATP
jgi:fibronectin type 3 domain-containing protein